MILRSTPDRTRGRSGAILTRAATLKSTVCRFGLVLLATPCVLFAQDSNSAALADDQESESDRTGFASFDVGFGVVLPEEGQTGISYGLGVDVANLLIHQTSIRFGFRFWTSEDRLPTGRLVDLDDSILSIMLKKGFSLGRLEGYGALGPGGHFISARFTDFAGERDERNGFRVGLEGIAGLEFPLVDRGFVSLFGEAQGSLVSDLSQVSLHAGIRIRFDRLGTGG
ncbi:MAG: hypothetical protein M8863_05285 [marine benthic group bacterium]|jgi:hypothetical protein|nr:hypothetical protein [Gemmatimonadota bacterium]